MPRQEKIEVSDALREATLRAILELHYWPSNWHLSLFFGSKPTVQLIHRKRTKEHPPRRYLRLTVKPDWLEKIHATGLAVINSNFILDANDWEEDSPGWGLDRFLIASVTYPEMDKSVRKFLLYLAHYGNEWGQSDVSPGNAARDVLNRFKKMLLPEPDTLPF